MERTWWHYLPTGNATHFFGLEADRFGYQVIGMANSDHMRWSEFAGMVIIPHLELQGRMTD